MTGILKISADGRHADPRQVQRLARPPHLLHHLPRHPAQRPNASRGYLRILMRLQKDNRQAEYFDVSGLIYSCVRPADGPMSPAASRPRSQILLAQAHSGVRPIGKKRRPSKLHLERRCTKGIPRHDSWRLPGCSFVRNFMNSAGAQPGSAGS